jgi:cytochrome P450
MDRYLHAEISKRLAEARNERKGAVQSKAIISLVLKTYLTENEGRPDSTAVDEEFKKVAAAQVRIFLFAGHDTTSSTLLFCYHELSRHPQVLARMRAEHDEVFGRDFKRAGFAITEDPSRLNRLPYTVAVIREVLRLHPPSSQMRRGREGFELVDLDGTRLPTEGCNIWVLTNALHENPRHWGDDPTAFIPDRWLVGPGDPLYPEKGAWRPFMLGPRNCIGQTLALTELRVALVMTVREFDVRPAYGEWDALHPRQGVKTIDGERAYASEKGGGGAHPSDGYPCRVERRAVKEK